MRSSWGQFDRLSLLLSRELTLLLFVPDGSEVPRVWNANELLLATCRDMVHSGTEPLRKLKQVIQDLNGYARGKWINEVVAVSLRWPHKC
jgi:hypothetical protein